MMEDTICAISTPLGEGGIGIIRISGPDALAIGKRIFKSPKKNFNGFRPYTLHHGWILSPTGEILDEVLVSYMPGPGSYTGEDVFEINCHGGPVVTQTILQNIMDMGIRLAEPGEFTLRAFLNGRIDLSQAEAVAEIISSPSPLALFSASQKLSGHFRVLIENLKKSLEETMAYLAAEMDFEETEDIPLDLSSLKKSLSNLLPPLKSLITNYNRFRIFQEGAKVILCGEVNAGKSSLLNTILGRERAIVTPVPGTTRDYIEESLYLEGIPVKLIDTAGFRETANHIELIGIEKGKQIIQEGDIVCLIYDSSRPFNEHYLNYLLSIKSQTTILLVANKIDLPSYPSNPPIGKRYKGIESIGVSATKYINIDTLLKKLKEKLTGGKGEPRHSEIIPNLRQYKKLRSAYKEIQNALSTLEKSIGIEIVFSHLEKARDHLREITGEISTEDILERIFSSFCIGK